MIALKPGVSLRGISPQILLAVMIAEAAWQEAGLPVVTITSANDGQHPGGGRPSFHPKGQAVDLRIKDVPVELRDRMVTRLAWALGTEFDVLHEGKGTDNEHLHIQWDPQGGA